MGLRVRRPDKRVSTTTETPLNPLSGMQLALGTLAVSMASMMNVIDTTITNVSISAISGNLGASPSQGTWVITSYTAANAVMVLLSGWLAQRIGQVRLLSLAISLFALSSLCCALSPTLDTLILFRLVQGLSAGPMVSMGQPLLMQIYPRERMGFALSIWSGTTMIGPMVGPLLGGYLTDYLSWHWIFYINVPIAALTLWMLRTVYRGRESPTRRVPIDRVGLLLVVVWVSALQIVVDKGRELDWFASGEIVALTLVAVVAFAYFLVWERDDPHPVVDLSLFRSRNFSIGVLMFGTSYAALFGGTVIQPLWLMQYQGYTASATAWLLTSAGIMGVLLLPVVGQRVHRYEPRMLASVSLGLLAFTFYLRTEFTSGVDMYTILIPYVLIGISMSIYVIPIFVIAYGGLAAERMANASSIMNFTRYFLAALSASLMTTLWDQRQSLHHSQLAESLDGPRAEGFLSMLGAGPAGFDGLQANAILNRLVDIEAAVLGANDVYWVAGMLVLFGACLVWLSRPGTNSAAH